ncbi:DNA cytosine methyltransferase [Burkholderia vietnamiensis]|uniref:DNA cytosine methyltransferase n=1 Tax=Burkholderia vietnamiensis TaxID=60552 RepID=UPI00158FFF22|nr:DNA (cytosine-5-)-methyltransferase [Burkholderia vietnamiensis]
MAKTGKKSSPPSTPQRVNSFFAGIGGFDLAFEKNGFTSTFYCENNEFCRSVLKRHWPSTTNASDISKVDPNIIPQADVWTAGFPCQDLSLARTPHGKRHGLNGSRSGLFYTFLDLLAAHKPPVVLLENVAGLLNSHKGADFEALIKSLTNLGYAVAWRVFNARYFGAPQSRPRIFICAWLGSPILATNVLFEDTIAQKPKNERQGFVKESKCSVSGISVPKTSFCISATSGRHTGLDWARSYVTYSDSVRRLTPLECERLQGLPDNWTLPDKDYPIPIRGIETNRYHAIGNAVCVPVVSWIAARIANSLRSPSNEIGDQASLFSESPLENLAKKYLSSKSGVDSFSDNSDIIKWKSGGIAFGNEFVTAPASPSPVKPIDSSLIDVIEKTDVHERYFISTNAAQGILRRVDKLGRNLFSPLDTTLRKMVAKETIAQEMEDIHPIETVVAS